MGSIKLKSRHRVLCGDSTSADDVERLMDGEMADLCFSDPPYGIGDSKSEKNNYETHIDSHENLVGLIAGFFPLAASHSKVVALTPGVPNMRLYDEPSWTLCWFTGSGTACGPWGFGTWQPVMVWGACPKLAAGEGRHPDGFQFLPSGDDSAQNRDLEHACPKPLSVWRRFMERLCNASTSTILDPFLGSGTTLIAAEQLGRRCYGLEISPAYCDVIVNRWQKLTGEKAVLNG